jgi:hypothetical protein
MAITRTHDASADLIGGGQLSAHVGIIAVTSALIIGDGGMERVPANDPDAASKLQADAGAIETFANALFRHATPGTYIHYRGFDEHNADAKIAVFEYAIIPPDGDLRQIAALAARLATLAARFSPPSNFCPPIATFSDPKKGKAEHLADGLAIQVDLDKRPQAGRDRLVAVLGPPTVIVATGGTWIDPETNVVEDKVHAYWRLKRPARTPEEHTLLKYANEVACALVGGDRSAITPVHPMRWPGSWHRKGNPRRAFIAEINDDTEIDLGGAMAILDQASGLGDEGAYPTGAPCTDSTVTTAPFDEIQCWMQVIPNDDVEWSGWRNMALRIYGATGGSEDGRWLAHKWSAKSRKYNADNTNKAWDEIHRSPPDKTGAKQLEYLACLVLAERECDPIWLAMLDEKVVDYEHMTADEYAAFIAGVAAATRDDRWQASMRREAEYQRRRPIANGAPASDKATAPDGSAATANEQADSSQAPQADPEPRFDETPQTKSDDAPQPDQRHDNQGTEEDTAADDRAYAVCREMLDNVRQDLAKETFGRDTMLSICAQMLGQHAHYGAYDEDEARATLRDACQANGYMAGHADSFDATFDNWWRKGIDEPKTITFDDKKRSGDQQTADDQQQSQDSFTAAELAQRTYPELEWYVAGWMAIGLAILAGRSKIGKSWLAFALALDIAGGATTLGNITTRQCEVLYLALEDSGRRLQSRMRMLLGDQPAPEGLHIELAWPRLAVGGCLTKLDAWLDQHPACRVVIIDTFGKIRGQWGEQRKNAYQADYDEVGLLHQYAHRRNIVLVLVHHTRKAGADDVFDMISGTTGIIGAADTLLVLQRKRDDVMGTLSLTGRDVQGDGDYAVSFDQTTGRWTVVGKAAEVKAEREQSAVYRYLHQADGPQMPSGIAEELDKPRNAIQKTLHRLKRQGRVASVGHGLWTTAERAKKMQEEMAGERQGKML